MQGELQGDVEGYNKLIGTVIPIAKAFIFIFKKEYFGRFNNYIPHLE